jgi:hypothetical protein
MRGKFGIGSGNGCGCSYVWGADRSLRVGRIDAEREVCDVEVFFEVGVDGGDKEGVAWFGCFEEVLNHAWVVVVKRVRWRLAVYSCVVPICSTPCHDVSEDEIWDCSVPFFRVFGVDN